MNNKQLGTAFEQEMVDLLARNNYWVHFITPDNRGAQPFDLIFAKDGIAMVADCKTSSKRNFSFKRLEDNQIFAFEKWMACGNAEPVIFVKYKDRIYTVPYKLLRNCGKVDLYAL